MPALPPRPLAVVPLLLLLSGARASEDACAGGHVVATATDVDFFPFCCVQDSGILMASWQASGYDISAFEGLYVTVHDGTHSWPPSDYLIANAMTFVLERDDGNYYYIKYSSYPADYVAQQTPLSIGSDSNVADTKVTLTAYAAGCAPSHPPPLTPPPHAPSPEHPPPSPYPARPPPPSAPSPPSPPVPPSSPPPLAPREGMISWEPWMPVIILGTCGPLLLVGAFFASIRCCNLYRMEPRPSEELRVLRTNEERTRRDVESLRLDSQRSKESLAQAPGPRRVQFVL